MRDWVTKALVQLLRGHLDVMRRLLDRYAGTQDHMWAETLLPKASDEELERLVEVALNVVAEEAKG